MPNLTADRVKETTTTTGTGTITLAGAVAQFRSFASAFADGSVVQYAIVGQTGTEWEVGNGTFTASGTTLARTTVLASSNSGSAVNFSAGTKDVFATVTAAHLLAAVLGPSSATDNAIAVFDSTTGKLLKVATCKIDASTGAVLAPNGSSGAPTLTFENDPDTGVYRESANVVGIAVGGNRRLYVDDNGIYPTGRIWGHGGVGHSIVGFLVDVTTSTAGSGAPRAAQDYESLATFTNEGASAENYHQLPSAVKGYRYTFVVQNANGVRIVAAAGDTIRPGTVAASSTAGFIRCATAGATITLQAINATEWVAVSMIGTWTVDV